MGASSPLLADGCWVAMRHRDTEGKLCIKGNLKLLLTHVDIHNKRG